MSVRAEHESFIINLVILSALQSAVINPIVFVLLGLGRAYASEQRGIERRARANTHFADSGGSPGDGRREGSAFARGYGGASGSSPGGARAGGGQQPQQSASLSSVLLEVIKGFRKNMLVLSVCLASVWNLSTQRAPLPWWLGVPIQLSLIHI